MPLMDGMKQRALSANNQITTPIVAMTANVMAQDIEKMYASRDEFSCR